MNPSGYHSVPFYLPAFKETKMEKILKDSTLFRAALLEAMEVRGLKPNSVVWLENNGVIHTRQETTFTIPPEPGTKSQALGNLDNLDKI